MAANSLGYHSAMMNGRAKAIEKTKREQAADLFNEARKLAREALDEENKEAELRNEYGPRSEKPITSVPQVTRHK